MSGKNESTNYSGPETNEVYSDEDTFETFEDLDDDDTYSDEPAKSEQSATSHEDKDDEEDEDEEEEVKSEKARKAARNKKEQAKKARGQKGDDLDSLDRESEEDSDEEDEDEEVVEDEDEEEEVKEEKPKTEDKKPKGKPTYVTVDGETYALESSALVSTKVDGKIEKVSIQELQNNYAGKVAYDKKFNEINLKEQGVKRTEAEVAQKLSQFNGVKQQIEEIIKDENKNPLDALKIFLDSTGVDSYDLMERVFKSQLSELATVLNMEKDERRAYYLEKKNSHLLEQSRKRDEQSQNAERVNSYKQKADALRKSYGVSEAQYVDALEELKSFEGVKEKDLTEKEIVEWAATKPHRETVRSLLTPYRDQFDEDSYGELSWKLANILRVGSETPDAIKKNLAEVYGVPTEVKTLSKKLNPLGRKSKTPNKPSPKSKPKYETFEDLDDEDED